VAEQRYTPEEYLKELESCLKEHGETLGKLKNRAEVDAKRQKELEKEIPETTAELTWLKKKLPSMKEELAGLGFFAGKKKKEITALIETAETTIKEMTDELAAMKDELSTIILDKAREKLLAEQSIVSDLESDIEQVKQFIEQTKEKKKRPKKPAAKKVELEGSDYNLFVFDPDDDDDEPED